GTSAQCHRHTSRWISPRCRTSRWLDPRQGAACRAASESMRITATRGRIVELVCPAGSPAALEAAVEAGADAIYTGFRDGTNARSFAGLNFTDLQLARARDYTRAHGRRLFIAVNTYVQPQRWADWQR